MYRVFLACFANSGQVDQSVMIINARLVYSMTMIGYFGLLSSIMLWNTVLDPVPHSQVALILLLVVVPLLFPLRGLLHGRPSSNIFVALLSLVYFVHGVTVAASDPSLRIFIVLEIFFSLVLFFGACFYLQSMKPR